MTNAKARYVRKTLINWLVGGPFVSGTNFDNAIAEASMDFRYNTNTDLLSEFRSKDYGRHADIADGEILTTLADLRKTIA